MKQRLIICATLSAFITFAQASICEDWQTVFQQAQSDLQQGNLDKAEEEFRTAEKLIEAAKITGGKEELKANGLALINCLVGISKVKDRKGEVAESEKIYGMALETVKKFSENDWKSQEYADYLPGIAELYDRHGKTEMAENAFKQLIEVRTKYPPKDDNKIIAAYENYSKFLRAHNRSDEAVALENKASQMKYNLQD